MPGDGEDAFGVSPADVVRHARSIDDVAHGVDGARRAALTVELGRAAYGILCAELPTLFDPLQHGAVDAFRDAADALSRTADDLRNAADGYQVADQSSADLMPDG
ncbi:type VII secretion target [Cryptosporangium phraense]|uniref:type VII secretion target n=1 Tax=Cryptosporangium phraense TaxID=2593070 RepID=UPI00197A9B33|nr:type VII secretion target [Cryptosporangium phraense]